MIDRPAFEQEVLQTLNRHLEPFHRLSLGGRRIFHATRLEREYPDTEVITTYSFTDDPTRREVRDRIWDYVEKYGETTQRNPRAEDLAVLMATYLRGG
jgi:hypothetical protein